jgi:hypothetical protein
MQGQRQQQLRLLLRGERRGILARTQEPFVQGGIVLRKLREEQPVELQQPFAVVQTLEADAGRQAGNGGCSQARVTVRIKTENYINRTVPGS